MARERELKKGDRDKMAILQISLTWITGLMTNRRNREKKVE